MNQIYYKTFKFYSFLRLLSIDIVLGVLCGAYFASIVFDVKPSVYYWITLVSTVWVIYTIDHLLDGIRSKGKFIFKSYLFHFKHQKIFLIVTSVLAVCTAFIVFFFLEKELFLFGIYTFVLVIIYLLINFSFRKKRKFFPKEIIISILYTWGIFGGFVVIKGGINIFQSLIFLNYTLLVFTNVLLYSYFDSEKDEIGKFNTIAVNFGAKLTRKLISVILLISILITFFTGVYFNSWIEVIILFSMTLTLYIIILKEESFKENKYYGIVADAAFFIPSFLFFVNLF